MLFRCYHLQNFFVEKKIIKKNSVELSERTIEFAPTFTKIFNSSQGIIT